MDEWEVGDIVRLKEGGPPMTIVVHLRPGDRELCIWLRGDRLGAAVFHQSLLVKNDYEQEPK